MGLFLNSGIGLHMNPRSEEGFWAHMLEFLLEGTNSAEFSLSKKQNINPQTTPCLSCYNCLKNQNNYLNQTSSYIHIAHWKIITLLNIISTLYYTSKKKKKKNTPLQEKGERSYFFQKKKKKRGGEINMAMSKETRSWKFLELHFQMQSSWIGAWYWCYCAKGKTCHQCPSVD